MCCRYFMDDSNEMQALGEEAKRSPLAWEWIQRYKITTSGEVRPTDIVPVIASNRNKRRAVFPMKWGFSGKTILMNARVETAAEKPTFRDAWEKHRCIVPASYYFEWEHLLGNDGKKHTGYKYLIQPKGSSMTWLCGLYRFEDNLPVFVILTREPGEQIRFIHDRMPLILPEHLVNEWISPDSNPQKLIGEAVTDVFAEKTV